MANLTGAEEGLLSDGPASEVGVADGAVRVRATIIVRMVALHPED